MLLQNQKLSPHCNAPRKGYSEEILNFFAVGRAVVSIISSVGFITCRNVLGVGRSGFIAYEYLQGEEKEEEEEEEAKEEEGFGLVSLIVGRLDSGLLLRGQLLLNN